MQNHIETYRMDIHNLNIKIKLSCGFLHTKQYLNVNIYKRKSSVREHLKTNHTDDKLFKCDVCLIENII